MQPVSHIVAVRIVPLCWNSCRHTFCYNIWGLKAHNQAESQRPADIIRNSSSKFLHTASAEDKISLSDDSKSTLRKLVEDVGIDEETFNKAFRKEPRLLDVHHSIWENSLKALRACGFSGKECLSMFIASPSLLKTKPDALLSGVKNWQSTVLGEQKLISLLTLCPQLLFVERHEIYRRFPVLKTLSSQDNVVELLRRYPDYMFVDWNDFLAKVNYVEEEMKINRIQISKCDLLSCSLLELRTRHMFLERTGNYIPPNPKTAEHLPNKNPSLRQIIDSDDIHFATKLAGVTVEEFEVFRELYKEELNQTVHDYSDSD
ncbi:transcription termination factor 4, mitochondrial [Schistocerca piceifrons]|uniref:transcription termination factor 4, mitochondrial n=1 Tax=Schistocerca piceifrons TaxID=274613 RepID=UPI001F5E841A|nr:transcription termination factor 4, mitochondrial [Schistocerca piceifrons]